MIIVKLISGLGNQLFQYAVGRQLALKHNVPLKFDTSFFRSQHLRNYKLDNYNITNEIATEEEIQYFLNFYESKRVLFKLYRTAEKFLPKNKQRYFKEKEWWVYEPELLRCSSNVYLDGYWQHYKYYEDINPIILKELSFKGTLNLEVKKLLHEMKENVSVSIHVRRGDYLTDSLMTALPLEYYEKAVKQLTQKLHHPSFYVFSDDLNWAKENLKIDAPSTFIDIEAGRNESLELVLMSNCKHNIIANSSFSWWGAFLNRYPEKMVIAPYKWVTPNDINSRIKLQLPSWIKL